MGFFNKKIETKQEPVIPVKPMSSVTTIPEENYEVYDEKEVNKIEPKVEQEEVYEEPETEELREDISEEIEETEEDKELALLDEKRAQLEAQKAAKLAQKQGKDAVEVDNPNISLGMDKQELQSTIEQLITLSQEMDSRLQKIESFIFRGIRI